METAVVKFGPKTTKMGKIVYVLDVMHGKPRPTTIWHMTMEALIDIRKSGKDLNAMIDSYEKAVSKMRTEIVVPPKPKVEEFDFTL